ncbi:MAG: epoxyqueuosine reductase QueH [Thermodesulfobacteriota bacterium]
MKILLHTCCGPCSIYPLSQLRAQGHQVTGYFYNPNIHPFREFKKRLAAMRLFAAKEGLEVIYDVNYGLTEYLRQVVYNEKERCRICYGMRLAEVASLAAEKGFEAFTTSLLYSRYQQHAEIRKQSEDLAAKHGLVFLYEDFRQGWQEGIDASLAMDLYRQPYCGCIYSEQERYDKKMRKEKA